MNYFLSLLSDIDRKAFINDLSEQQKVLDAKKAEEKAGAGKKKGGETESIINQYMQKRDDLEFRTLQELNQQMTNWVETVQTQNYAAGNQLDPLDQQLYDQYGLSDTDSDSDSDFLDEKLQHVKAKLRKKRKARQTKKDNADGSSSDSSSGSDGTVKTEDCLPSEEETKDAKPPRKKQKKEKKRLEAQRDQLEAQRDQMMR